ncbi:hypothetical protein G4X40_20260 [Rhodococcus sp. D2-41]|nr:hypothetical protein [Rhodococcus sp. D2-41]
MRWGDTSANHPIVLTVLEHEACDDRLVNEVHGFITRCAAQAGAHLTDYVVTRGTAVLCAGPSRVDVLLTVATAAGYLTEVTVDGRTAYKLVDDDPEFLHLRLRAEVEWERQRRTDNSNPALIVPVRLRDGDGCRWCGKVVNWAAKTGARSGTYDHLVPGSPATVDTYVVACRGCNSSRKDGSHPRAAGELLPVPVRPYFSPYSCDWLEANAWRKTNGCTVPPRPRKVITPGNPAPGHEPGATTAGQRPDTQSRNARTHHGASTGSTPVSASPAAQAQRPDTQSENAQNPNLTSTRPDSQSDHAPNPVRPDTQPGNATHDDQHKPASCQDPVRKPQDPTRREGTDPVRPGRDGTGRDGSGREPSPTPPLGDMPSPSRSPTHRGRGRRSRRRHTTGHHHQENP